MEDEGNKGIIEMDNAVSLQVQADDESHDTGDKPSDFAITEENSDLLSSILPQVCESELLVGPPPFLSAEVEGKIEEEVTFSPEIDVLQGPVDAAEDDEKVTEEGKSEPILVEGDTLFMGAEPAVDLAEDAAVAIEGAVLNLDGPEIEPSKSLDVTQDEETQIAENVMKMKDDEEGSEGKEWRWTSCESDPQFASVDSLIHSDDFDAIVTDVVPTKANYDIESGNETQSFENGAGNCLPESDNLQSLDVQSSIPAINPQDVDVQSPVASKLSQEDEASIYMTLSGTVGDLAPEPDNVELSGYESLPVGLVSVEDEIMREENVGITEIDDATEVIEENPIQLLDDLQTVDDFEDEAPVKENETPITETEMETETEIPETEEQDNGSGTVEEIPIQLLDDLQNIDDDSTKDDEEPLEEEPMEEEPLEEEPMEEEPMEEEPMEEDETPTAETEMEAETDVPEMAEQDNEGGTVDLQTLEEDPIQSLDGLQTVDDDSTKADEDEEPMEENETPTGETEIETEIDIPEMPEQDNEGEAVAGKRKRGKNTKVPLRSSYKKTTGEDVCFICFDGGELVLCDRRGCHKAYHPSCVNHDEAFFQSEGRWNCGWHLCSICEKNARYMCYTCTFSLCQRCTKDAVISCVRGNKGFCETCMKTVMWIENNESANKEDQVDFDDKNSWEYLFKDYWTDLKGKLSLTADELSQAKNPRRLSVGKDELNEENLDTNDGNSGSDSSENQADRKPKKRMSKRRSKLNENTEEADLPNVSETAYVPENTEWASKELLEFVMHMKDGDNSVLSQFDVQALLLEYIKRNKLRDPRRKSQIVCDARLVNLFGKARVGHFEMLKLLESHFLMKTDTQIDDVQGIVVDTDVNPVERDGITDSSFKGSKEKKRKARKKGYDREPQSNLDDYAAIDNHNINLICLRRKLIEDVLEDVDKFHDTIVGTFVRIRIPGNNQKQDLYRLVQVTGTTKADYPYKVGKRTTGFYLEVLNLDKTEVVAIDTISNQDFTEDECKRLRQSIKCGLINRLTVGDILNKATEIHAARVNDWLEAETQRISHLRDRASEKGRRKELRECVEKLQVLKTPEERRRRLEEIPEINADPKMDPNYESEDNDSDREETRQENFSRPRVVSGFSRNGREPISPGGGNLTDSGSGGSRKYSERNWEFSRSSSGKDFLNRSDDKASVSTFLADDSIRNQGRDGGSLQQSNYFEPALKSETSGQAKHPVVRSDSFSSATGSNPSSTVPKIKETEKMWLYKDPSGKIQGPFSVVQLRKWNSTGYFPADLRIWRNTEDEDRSMFLKDTLAGRFNNQDSQSHLPSPTPPVKKLHGDQIGDKWRSSPPTVHISKHSTDRLGSDYITRNDNLPSPTPTTPTMSSSVNQAIIRGQGHNKVESLGISDLNSAREWVPKQEMVQPQQASQPESTRNINVPSQISEHVYVQSYGSNISTTTPAAGLPQAETWRPQIVQQQLQQQPSSSSWGGNMVMSSSWGGMTGNQQMGGWGGPTTPVPAPVPVPVPVPTANMNWNMAPPPQGGSMNPSGGWAVPGNHPPVPMQQGFMPGMGNNQSWFPPQMGTTGQMPGNGWFQPPPVTNQPPPQGPPPGNMNGATTWGGGSQMGGNAVGHVQGGLSGPGNANQNWSSSSQNGNRFSGQNRGRDLGRGDDGSGNNRGGWNGGGGGRSGRNNNNNNNQRVCQYHLNGHCKKGSACRQPHN